MVAGSLTLSVFALGAGCGHREPAPRGGPAVKRATSHFVISATGVDSARVDGLARYLESNRTRVLADLQAATVGTTLVHIQTNADFDAQWGSIIKAAGLGFQPKALTGADGAIFIYGPWARGQDATQLGQVALHEFAHVATRRAALEHVLAVGGDTLAFLAALGPAGARMRWLAEAIALYEAGQSTDLNRFGYLLRGRYPSIAQLNDPANSQIYDIGYRLSEYIVATWGPNALLALVTHDADVRGALGISEDELMRRWFAHVEDRYLLVKPRWWRRRR